MRDVMAKSAEHGRLRQGYRCLSFVDVGGVEASQEAAGDVAHISFDPCDLARKKQVRSDQ